MPNKLFIRPLSASFHVGAVFDWALYDVAGQQAKLGAPASLEAIDQTLMQNGLDNLDVVLLWPASMALSTHVAVPGNQTRYIQQALPYLVEEQVAQDIEQLHLSLGAKQSNGEYQVVGIDYALFEAAYNLVNDQLEMGNLKAIVLDTDSLVLGESDLVIYLSESEEALVNAGNGQSIRMPSRNLQAYLDTLDLDGDSGEFVKTRLLVSDRFDAQMLEAELAQHDALEIDKTSISLSEMELLCEGYFSHTKATVNLCQGDFKAAASSNSAWMKWRSVAAILVVGFILQLGVFIGKGMYYQDQANLVGEQALAEYKKAVPNAKRVSIEKLPRIIKGKLNQSRNQPASETDFLTLLGEAGYQFNRAKDKTNLAFKSITYSEQRGELIMEMQASSFEQLDQLKQAIVDAGLTAKISSAVQEEKFFRGRISVGG